MTWLSWSYCKGDTRGGNDRASRGVGRQGYVGGEESGKVGAPVDGVETAWVCRWR